MSKTKSIIILFVFLIFTIFLAWAQADSLLDKDSEYLGYLHNESSIDFYAVLAQHDEPIVGPVYLKPGVYHKVMIPAGKYKVDIFHITSKGRVIEKSFIFDISAKILSKFKGPFVILFRDSDTEALKV
jgi:hypothetical protein